MKTVETIADLRAVVKNWRGAGERVGFVPTMGNLHEGHLTLVKEAKKISDRVVTSIFVNPTQFGEGEDFDAYPRTESADAEALTEAGADLLFLPSVAEMYPGNGRKAAFVEVPGISGIHCGAHRPGHFRGVATVVCKLFNMVLPDVALFGEKDFQQLSVIRYMVADLNMPVEVVGVPTVREADGLAMSSRNGYLSADERKQAACLYKLLKEAKQMVCDGECSIAEIESRQIEKLTKQGFEPDYFSIVRRDDLEPAGVDDAELVILAAARLGKPRLIDNLIFDRPL